MLSESEQYILENNFCRCCHSKGNDNMFAENNTENYANMLKNCFQIIISPINGKYCDICSQCITRLADAHNFKKQVLENEEKLYQICKDIFTENSNSSEVKHEAQEIKTEFVSADSDTIVKSDEFVSADSDTNIDVKSDADSEEDMHLSELRELKKKNICKTRRKDKSSTKKEKVGRLERTMHVRHLVKTILMCSSALPFRWNCNKFMCFFCEKTFTNISELRLHNSDHADVKLEKAVKIVTSSTKVKLDITNLTCKLCPKKLPNIDELLQHIASEHKQTYKNESRCCIFPYKISDDNSPCSECGQNFRFFGNLLSHIYQNHSTTGPFLCDTCGKGFLTKYNLKNHFERSHKKVEYKCTKCTEVFKTHGAFAYHKFTHNREFLCHFCPEKFPSWYLRKQHMVIHDKSLGFSCELCPKTFVKYNSLKFHLMSAHHYEKPVSCDFCEQKFVNKSALNRHMFKHNKVKPYQCHVCAKSFSRKQHLEIHVRIHNNDRRYNCKECGKKFVQPTGLKVHMKSHHVQPDGN